MDSGWQAIQEAKKRSFPSVTAQEKEIQDRDFRGGEIMTREMPQFTCSLQTVDIHYLCHEGEDRVRMQKKKMIKALIKKEERSMIKVPRDFLWPRYFTLRCQTA